MGLCAQTPGHIVVQEKGFSCTHIVYHNGRYFAHRKKYNFFNIFKKIFKRLMTSLWKKLYKKKKKI